MRICLALAGLLSAAIFYAAPTRAAASDHSPLHGALPRRTHAVGFTKLQLADASRPPRTPGNNDSASPGARARRIDVHVWYPAAHGSTAAPMTFADAMSEHLLVKSPAEIATREAAVRRFLGEFGPVGDEAWARLKSTRLLARRDVPAAAGRYPLLIGSLRPLSTNIINELLASHGFVVAMVDGQDETEPEDSGAARHRLPRHGVRDPGAAQAARRPLPGRSARSASAVPVSRRSCWRCAIPTSPRVCDLESAIFDDRMMHPLSRGWGYAVDALRVPFLHTYSAPLSKRENRIGDFEAMRYSIRYQYLVDAPGIHHWDFATEGMAASSVLRNRGENGARLQQAFEVTNLYVLKFFSAYLKNDSEALAFLARTPEANGVPAGLATVRVLPAVRPAPTTDDIFAIVSAQGVGAAMQRLDDARKTDPQASVFEEARLNRLGYRVLRSGSAAAALPIFRRIVEWFPASSNAYDSLAEALETAGDTREAVAVSRQGLDVLAKQELTPQQRHDMAGLLETRIKRLK